MSLAMRMLCLLTATALLVVALPATAQEGMDPGIYNPNQSTPTTMYFHINGLQDFPVNTQKPSDKYAETPSLGLATHSSCIEDQGQGALLSRSAHTWYGYSSPGYVEYDYDENGKPRIHPERGISFNPEIDTSVQPVFTWYLENRILNTGEESNNQAVNQIPAPIPNVVLRATVRMGDDISVGHSALNTGEIIAIGETAPANLAGPMTNGAGVDEGTVEYVDGGGKHLYKFQFPLDVNLGEIDKDESYNIRVDTFISGNPAPGCDGPGQQDSGDYVMLDYVSIHTSPDYRPQMDWNIMNPLRIEYLHPQFIGDDMVIHTSTNSPWGNYDVRGDQASEAGGSLEVEVTGPSPALSLERVALTARTHEHDHHTEAVDATWIWEYKKDGAKNGLYTVVFKAKNDQETATATAVAQFEIGSGRILGCGGQEKGGGQSDCVEDVQADGGGGVNQESPGVGFAVVLGLVAAAAFAARRRD